MRYNFDNIQGCNSDEYWVKDHCYRRRECPDRDNFDNDSNNDGNNDNNNENQNCNRVNVFLNGKDYEKNYGKDYEKKYCKDDEKKKKYGCCCDTKKLEFILKIFQKNQSKVWIFTHHTYFPYFSLSDGFHYGYIRDIKDNLVYLALDDYNNETEYVIPICNIIWAIAESCQIEDDKKIRRIMKIPTLEKECCCSCDILEAVKERFNYFGPFLPWFGVQLKDGWLTALYAWYLWYCVLPYLDDPKIELIANCDLIIESLCYDDKIYYSIIPNCAIDTISTKEFDNSDLQTQELSVPSNIIMSDDMRRAFEKLIEEAKNK
ncbi:hypothetical protein [Anaerovorax odorimutans]|uniref:hypothetical protein n=1 Tax=Anaerovorax odorimutans TaxID=109327 RepID=UPI00040CE761|nr:hypothetical protein [Anaerovorax odorimutans]